VEKRKIDHLLNCLLNYLGAQRSKKKIERKPLVLHFNGDGVLFFARYWLSPLLAAGSRTSTLRKTISVVVKNWFCKDIKMAFQSSTEWI